MGSNLEGQLGLKHQKGFNPMLNSEFCEPELIQDLKFNKVVKVRAGKFSAALTADQQLYIWGRGVFGEFKTPHRVKASNKLKIKDFQISTGGIAIFLSKQGELYSWGDNQFGQLGHGDNDQRRAPHKI